MTRGGHRNNTTFLQVSGGADGDSDEDDGSRSSDEDEEGKADQVGRLMSFR